MVPTQHAMVPVVFEFLRDLTYRVNDNWLYGTYTDNGDTTATTATRRELFEHAARTRGIF